MSMCGVFLMLALVCLAAACTLLAHHYYKYADRCFQPVNTCVLCDTSCPLRALLARAVYRAARARGGRAGVAVFRMRVTHRRTPTTARFSRVSGVRTCGSSVYTASSPSFSISFSTPVDSSPAVSAARVQSDRAPNGTCTSTHKHIKRHSCVLCKARLCTC